MPNRREFMASAVGAALAPARRPNILFVMVDEMRWDAMGCERHPVVATPTLDRLSREGVRFSQAYTVAPVCSPSRACTFTGRYADVVGVTANGVPAHRGEIFLPTILKHHGYHTAIAGKLHYTPRQFDYGFDQFWSFTAEGPTPELGLAAHITRKYGQGARKFDVVEGSRPWPDDPLGSDVGLFKYKEEDFETAWLTDRSIDYLRSRKEIAQPWFLFTSYLKPHSPSVEPERWLRKYDPKGIPIPKLPPNIKEIRAALTGASKRQFIDDEQMLRVMSAAYYGAIAHVDYQVGRLLGELEKLGMAENTLVLFTADHGNMLGDRGRFFKSVMYEGSSHVPLLWREPKTSRAPAGRVIDRVVENTDLLPSILDCAGLPTLAGVQGRSFRNLARGEDSNWKDRCYSQLRTAMVRQGRYKFIDNSRDLSGAFELYDLKDDPKEERNLASDSRQAGRVADFKRQLTAWRSDKPAPIRIAGLSTPAYAQIGDTERDRFIQRAPDNQPRNRGVRRREP